MLKSLLTRLSFEHSYLWPLRAGLFALVGLIIGLQPAQAQTFTNGLHVNNAFVADNARDVHTADLDGDGDTDVLSASEDGATVTWHENDGAPEPTFRSRVIDDRSTRAQAVTTADVDNDGDLDIVAASSGDDTIAWYENDGDWNPTFTQHMISTQVNGAYDVVTADLDGDGDLDVASAARFSDTIYWHENDGAPSPSFTRHAILTTADGVRSLFAADIDGDSHVDLLSASVHDDTIRRLMNDGNTDPTFTASILNDQASGASGVIAVDLDQDGDVDVVSTSEDDDTLEWYDNDGSASFTTRVITGAPNAPSSVHAGDLDQNGTIDLLLTTAADDDVRWYDNDGTQTFTERFVATDQEFPSQVTTADLDADGDVDVLSALGATQEDAIKWHENNGSESFSTLGVTTNAYRPYDVFAADMDGDGDVDALSAASSTGITWYENTGSESYVPRVVDDAPDARRVHVLDFDNDGDEDVVTASFRDSEVYWYENDGATHPGFTKHLAYSADQFDDPNPFGVYGADVDSDGDTDIVVALQRDDEIVLLENDDANPNTSFTTHVLVSNLTSVRTVTARDIDGDADLDLVSASADGVAWHENDGSEAFTSHTLGSVTRNGQSALPIDVDGDTDVDVVAALDGTLTWFDNDGSESFTAREITTAVSNERDVYAADVDVDGDVDVLSASSGDNTIAWYESDGTSSPTFTRHTITTNADQARGVYAADLDGDTDLDVLSAAWGNHTIERFENTTQSALHTLTVRGTAGTGNDVGWRMLSLPTTSTLGQLDNDFSYDFQDDIATGAVAYTWTGSWSELSSDGAPLGRGQGFILFFFDDEADPLDRGGLTLDVPAGGETQNASTSASVPADPNRRFYLVGNPFDVAFDLGDLSGGDLSTDGFQQTVQVWNPTRQQYDPVAQGIDVDDIPAWQGVFLERTTLEQGADNLTFPASGRGTTRGEVRALREAASFIRGRLHLSVQEDGRVVDTDAVHALFHDAGATGWDSYDATKLPEPSAGPHALISAPSTRTGRSHRVLASEPLPSNDAPSVLPIAVRAVDLSGTATLRWIADTPMLDGWTVEIEDTKTGTVVDLTTEDAYTFDLSATSASLATPNDARFRLTVASGAPLPVELASFEATRNASDIVLTWATASESNNAGFAVQRRVDAGSWKPLGFVDGAGTTSHPQRYQFADRTPPYTADSLAYRLKQVDTDGTVALSEAIVLRPAVPAATAFLGPAPNPTGRYTTLRYELPAPADVRITIHDILGRRVQTVLDGSRTAGRKEIQFDASDLASGLYFVRFASRGLVATEKLVVTR